MSLIAAAHRSMALGPGFVLLAWTTVSAFAANEFQGKWSSSRPRCEQVNGEVDVLTVTSSGLAFYEIGCKLSNRRRDHDGVRFAARCYKGGSPETLGTAVIRRRSPGTIELALHGFSWTTEDPEIFHRCAAR